MNHPRYFLLLVLLPSCHESPIPGMLFACDPAWKTKSLSDPCGTGCACVPREGESYPGVCECGTGPKPDAACTPDCDGKDCGDDGCGGSCGTCTGGTECMDGACACRPEAYKGCCGDAVCWFDSCDNEGARISECPLGCAVDSCKGCTPSCDGKDCGDDGCGGLCGTCTGGKTCSGGICEAACTSECTGGTKKCPTGTTFTVCKDIDGKGCLKWDAPKACPSGQVCSGGVCACSPAKCPVVSGYTAACNEQQACEYTGAAGPPAVYVPGGPFWMGANKGDGKCPSNALDTEAQADETPCHSVTVPGFLIDKYEIRVDEYKGTPHCGQQAGDHPVVCIYHSEASAHCTGRGAGWRLCTESEWEKAARGTDGRKYPWGNEIHGCDEAVYSGCNCSGNSCPVGSKPAGASPYGVMDLAGNVWEWVEDCYHLTYDGAPADGTAWTTECYGSYRVFRGGGYFLYANVLRSSNRHYVDYGYVDLCARCCRSVL